MYGDGPPASQPSGSPPAQRACRAAADAPAPAAPTTWIRSPSAIGRGSRTGSSPAPGDAVVVTTGSWPTARSSCAAPLSRGRQTSQDRLDHRSGAVTTVGVPVSRPDDTPDVDAGLVGRRRCRSGPTGFSEEPPSGPAIPVTDAATDAPKRARAPSAIARATWALTAPCAARTVASTPSRSRFRLVRVRHDAAEKVPAGPRNRGQRRRDHPAGARFRERDRDAGPEAGRLEPLRELDERVVRHPTGAA